MIVPEMVASFYWRKYGAAARVGFDLPFIYLINFNLSLQHANKIAHKMMTHSKLL